MAMVDPTKAKRNIDFETYVEPKGERINWFEQAKTISDAFTDVATSRQKRKDAIDDNTKQTIDDLNALEAYDNQTLMNMTIDGTNNAANVIYEAEQAMKRGELRPSEFAKLKQNISAGFTQFEKNAKAWEADFKRYTQRMQGVDGVQSSSLEQYLGERMESFGNLKNLQLVTNPDTGNLAFGRIDPETGELLTGPDDLISINRMSAILKQEIDKVDVNTKVKDVVTSLGEYIAAGNATSMGKDGSVRSIVTIEDFMQTEDAEKTILDKAKTIAYNSFTTGSVLTDNGISNVHGENYKPGSQEEFDQWIAENPDKDPMDNPIIVMGYKKNGVIVEPAITERQQTAAEEYLVRQIKGALDYKETQKEFPPQRKTETDYRRADKRNEAFSYVDQAQKISTGTQQEFNEGVTTLSESYNNSPKGQKNPLAENPVDRNSDPNFILITYESGEVKKIPRYELDSNGDAVIDENGKKIPRDQQQQNAEILAYMSPVEGSTDQIYKEYNRNNPDGLKDYGGSEETVEYLGVGDKVIEDTDLSKELVMVDGSPVGVGDRFLEISQQDVDDEEQLAQYSTVVNSVLGSQIGELTKNFQVEPNDILTRPDNINEIKVTIEETPYTIRFNTNKDSAKLQSELQRIINAYKEKVRKGRKKKTTKKKKKLGKIEWMKANPGKTSADYLAYFNS